MNPKGEDVSDDDDDAFAKKARNTSKQGRTDSEKEVRQQQEAWNYWTGAGSPNDHLRYAADHGNSFKAKAKSEEGSKEAGKEDTKSIEAICEGATAHRQVESEPVRPKDSRNNLSRIFAKGCTKQHGSR